MTMTILQFTDINESTGDPIFPAQVRAVTQALSNTYYKLSTSLPIRAVLIYNDSDSTGIHVRVATAASGQDADQSDPYIGPDESGYFLIHRKQRAGSTDGIWVTAVADT